MSLHQNWKIHFEEWLFYVTRNFYSRTLLREIEVELAFFWIDSIFSQQSGVSTSGRVKKMDHRII